MTVSIINTTAAGEAVITAVPAAYAGVAATGAAGQAVSAAAAAMDAVGTAMQAMVTSPFFIAGIVMMVAMKVLMGGGCDKMDINTTNARDSGMCHEVGGYCDSKKALVGCIQKAKGFCCYNSKLARIMAEQGRPQLEAFGADGGWGGGKSPNCRGYTPEEFQSLDFNKIDLSEYYAVVERDMSEKVEKAKENMSDTVQFRLSQP